MTDFANEISGLSKQPRRLRHSKNEYRVYLALIFLAALPFCTVIWAYRLIRHMTLPTLGPIQSAISEARTITPRIFQT